MIVTPEEGPLRVFGREVSGQIKQLLADREIELVAGTHPKKFEAKHLTVAPGDPIYADAVISLPQMQGRTVKGIPHDDQGFVPTDYHGRVQGLDDVYAAGDVTAFPVKQGGLASQQADAIAELIAASVEPAIDPQPFDPILRGVLWTGEENKYLLGRLAPGHGEPSTLADEPPWPEQEGKIISRYLSGFLAEEALCFQESRCSDVETRSITQRSRPSESRAPPLSQVSISTWLMTRQQPAIPSTGTSEGTRKCS